MVGLDFGCFVVFVSGMVVFVGRCGLGEGVDF